MSAEIAVSDGMGKIDILYENVDFFFCSHISSLLPSHSLDVSFNCLETCAARFFLYACRRLQPASLCIHHRHSDTTPSSGQLNENKHLNSFFGFFIMREASLVCRAQPTNRSNALRHVQSETKKLCTAAAERATKVLIGACNLFHTLMLI